jgi:mRNA-degrading endonuclease RelE of RelBE toxin-antitoxin system
MGKKYRIEFKRTAIKDLEKIDQNATGQILSRINDLKNELKGDKMLLNPQIIKKDGESEFVVLPYKEYLSIKKKIEDYEDLIDLRKAKAETINEPSIPFGQVKKKFIPPRRDVVEDSIC